MRILVSVLSVCLTAGLAFGQSDRFTVNPAVFDPSDTRLVTAGWLGGLGCPTVFNDPTCPTGDPRDRQNEGLLLAKTGPTNNNAAAGATINGVRGDVFTDVGFDIRNGTHCGAGAPRFNIVFEGSSTVHFVGCAAMTTTSAGLYGQRKRATAAQLLPPIRPGNTIRSISIVFDEGQDNPTPSELGSGLAVIDNIHINGTLVGRGPQR